MVCRSLDIARPCREEATGSRRIRLVPQKNHPCPHRLRAVQCLSYSQNVAGLWLKCGIWDGKVSCSRLVLPPRLERPGTRSEGPDGRFGAKLFFKFFTTRVGWRIFTTDLSHGKNENFFALLKRFRRTTFC